MSNRPSKQDVLILEIVSVAAYVWYVYSVSRLTSKEDTYVAANLLYGWSHFCYGIARRFATMGIRAETTAFHIIDEEKL